MSEANSLYRRHRPASFDQVVGQEHVVRTLSNAITEGQIHHAYLFVGSRGTGKTSMAKILAASLNCENGGPTLTPCGECESCRTIAAGSSVDVIEMDAASNRSVEDIRELRERVAFAPAAGHWKVYILDEAHMLTKEAWNAFLKTLEEPPPNTVFILATTEAHKVMPTIADRCQRFDFHRPSVGELSEVVNRVASAEGIAIDPGTVSMIARAANGSFRDALGTLDQLVSFSGNEVSLEDVLELLGAADADLLFASIDAVVESDPKAVLEAVDTAVRGGRDPARFARDLLGHLRVLLLVRMTGEIPETFTPTVADPARLTTQAQAIGPSHLVLTIDELAAALGQIRNGDESRIALEIALLKAARPELDPSVEGLVRRIERIEQGEGRPVSDLPDLPEPSATAPAPAPAPPAEAPAPEAAPAEPAPAPDPEPEPVSQAPEPVPAEAPPEEPQEAGVFADLQHLIQVWPAVVEAIRAADTGPAASYFEGTRPVAVEGTGITVGFPPGADFNLRNAEKPERREQLAEAVLAVTGQSPELTYTELETDHEGEDGPAAANETIDEEELVEKVKAEFNAEEVI